MKEQLSSAEQRTYNHLCEYITKHDGMPPTVRELCVAANVVGPANIVRMLKRLVEKGWCKLAPAGTSRAYQPIDMPDSPERVELKRLIYCIRQDGQSPRVIDLANEMARRFNLN